MLPKEHYPRFAPIQEPP